MPLTLARLRAMPLSQLIALMINAEAAQNESIFELAAQVVKDRTKQATAILKGE